MLFHRIICTIIPYFSYLSLCYDFWILIHQIQVIGLFMPWRHRTDLCMLLVLIAVYVSVVLYIEANLVLSWHFLCLDIVNCNVKSPVLISHQSQHVDLFLLSQSCFLRFLIALCQPGCVTYHWWYLCSNGNAFFPCFIYTLVYKILDISCSFFFLGLTWIDADLLSLCRLLHFLFHS